MTSGYLRYPHVRGDQLVFVADDDIWLASVEGGRAHRLTADGHPPRSPRFSPDGGRVAFVSDVNGGFDLHVVELNGGRRRLTWLGASRMLVSGWLDEEHVLLASNHLEGNRPLTSLYSVSLDGDLERLPWGPAMAAAVHPDGRVVVASPNFRGPEGWKRYRGGMAVKLWVSDTKRRNWTRILPDEPASLQTPGWFGDRLIFTSDLDPAGQSPDKGAKKKHSGEPGDVLRRSRELQAQVWSTDFKGRDLRRHTNHGFDDGYVRDAVTDGTSIVFHARGQLFRMAGLDSEPRRIDLNVALGDPAPVQLAPTDRLEAIVPDHGGDGSLLDWRGTAWFLTHRGGPARALSDLPGVRIREPQILGDSGKAVWASDAEGDDCLEIMQLDGDGDPRRIAQGKLGRVLSIASSADGALVGVASHDGTISVVDTSKGTVKAVGRSGEGEPTGLVFSPDGRYLIWREAVANEGQLGRLVGYDLTDDKAFTITRGQFNDFSPAFSLDGKYLYFLSSRTIDPTYDELGFDLAFTHTIRPFVIPLRAEDPAPFGPSADGWNISEEEDEPKKEGDEEHKTDAVVFDLEGAESRLAPLPVPSGRYTALQASKDGVLWRRLSSYTGELGAGKVPGDELKDSIEFYDVGKRKLAVVVEACDAAWVSGDGKQLVVRNGEEVWVQAAEAKPAEDDDAKIHVDLARLRRELRPRDEWRQMFDENARLMRDHYWRDDMDGNDWAAITAAYRPLVERIASHDDLVDVLWETVGELNTSHAYVDPPEHAEETARVGLLGAEFGRNAKGEVVISRILSGESSDPTARSPLRAAGVAAQPGDVILAVDGRLTAEAPDIGALLQGSAEKVVELTLVRGRMKRRVAVVPIASEAGLRYHEWVARCAAYVREKSGGRVGYVHIPDMAAHGWAEFHRLIEEATRCEAVIADVRFNGGGHTSELIIERLSRRVIGWGFGRHYDRPFTYPFQGLRGPLVFVTNPFAGSDGDIVTAAAQNLGLGPVIGERSWGGTVGIDGRFSLVDGTEVTQPRYAHAFNDRGFALENHGTEPDIEVGMGPADWESDADIQLDRAITEALRRLDEAPAATPPQFDPPRVG
ncbi:PDZ domain-containing protein [Tessaracoccus sp. OS52]|uniref:S41 family peptidase n=1 Tax=Tessaracoccus sp. OS52 TaxID=2886691 RepID=UPI001D0F5948|nr:S41 family peptidase [Tessaracoccus sp. OS52]MCC2592573.1 PDZ domain-containing protein [Tessaracoccus sp. OS52]